MHCPTLKELPPPAHDKKGWPWTKESAQLPDIMPDGRPWPRISIVTPSYNQGQFIEETIRSVLLQGYPNLEYIIIDGGSTDNTIEIIKKYEPRLSHWVSERDNGQSHAINKGWEKSTGKILAWINADDRYCPEAIKNIAQAFCKQENIVLVCGGGQTFDVSGKKLISKKKPNIPNPYLLLERCGDVPMQPSVFLHRRVLDEVGFLNTRLHYVMDWEFWIRLGLNYEPDQFIKINKVLSNNREWKGTKTNEGWLNVCQEHRYVFNELFRKFPCDLEIQSIKSRAYSASYRKQASLAAQNSQTLKAIKNLFHAWALAPSAYKPLNELGSYLQSFLVRNGLQD